MKIIAVLEGRTDVVRESRQDLAINDPDKLELWPSDVNAITYVITTSDDGDRFVVHVIDAEDDGRGLFSIEGNFSELSRVVASIGEVITPAVPGNPPPPPPHIPPGVVVRAGLDSRHPLIGLAAIRRQVTRSFEQMQPRE